MQNKQADALLNRAYSLTSDSDAHELYQEWAITYDQTMIEGLAYLTPSRTAALLAEHISDPNSAVLDVGSGTGLAGEKLKAQGFINLDALDYSQAMLDLAKRRGIYGALYVADLNKAIALSDASYDALICTGTFTHAHVGSGCLDELFRILKPGGKFACTVHKDVWQEAGFDQKSEQLERDGLIKTLHQELGIYFETDVEPQGWYIVWERVL
ncbi:MAG: methyltransferase domain-containing protein [Pseudomonadota bacterium]